MSDTNAWAPIHHEDAEPEPTPAAQPKPAARRAQPARQQGTPVPVGMSLLLPPEVMDAIEDLAESQRDLAEQFARFTSTVEGWMKAMTNAKSETEAPAPAAPEQPAE